MEVRGGGADGCPLSLNPAAATEVHHDRGRLFLDETCERVAARYDAFFETKAFQDRLKCGRSAL